MFDMPQPAQTKRDSVDLRSIRARARAILHDEQDRGSSMVELALVSPVLLALLTGICGFGVAFSNQQTLTRAVGSGAQYLQQIRTTTLDPCQDTLTAIENAAPNLTPGSLSLSFSLNGTAVTGNSCSGDQSYLLPGQPVSVTATYPCVLHVYGFGLAGGCQLSAKVTEYEY